MSRNQGDRDPRVSPRPGDVLRGAKAKRARTVYSVDDGLVRMQISDSHTASWWGISVWRKWAASAEVVHRAGDGVAE